MYYPVKQWCRAAIVIDSDVEAIKYILMLGPEGFYLKEYMTQVLQWKADNVTFAIKRLLNPLSESQTNKLQNLSKFLCTIDEESGKYKDIFSLQEDQLINITLDDKRSAKSLKPKK